MTNSPPDTSDEDAGASPPSRPQRKGRKKPKKTTPARLRNIALYYLDQRGTSRANLRRVLLRRIDRALKEHGAEGGDREEQVGWVDTLLDELTRLGLLNDALYASQRARSLAHGGSGARKIRAKLREKGLAPEHIDAAIEALEPHNANDVDASATGLSAEWVAACRLARKRRLGPFRRDDAEPKRERELGTLARAGFGYDIAKRIVEATDRDALEDAIRDAGW